MAIVNKTQKFYNSPGFAVIILAFLAFFFNWPYLMGGFYGDDIIFLNLMDQDPKPYSWWRGIWSVNDYPFMHTIWWKDWKGIGDSGIFWRPVPSLVFEGFINIFGRNAFPLHLLSILLHAGVAAAFYFLVRALTNHHWPAFLAGLFFVTCEDHSMQVGWISTVTDLLSVQFILLAFIGHIYWLKRREFLYIIGSLIALIIAMACKETASIAPLAIILLTFFKPDDINSDFYVRSGLRYRLMQVLKDPLSWLPQVLILAAYFIMYKLFHLGALDNLMYIDPFSNPIGYLNHLVLHLPVMWLATFTPVPPSMTMFMPELLHILAIAGLIIFVAWLTALWPFRHKSIIIWAVLLYLMALLPQMAADASERALYFPMIPACILLAFVAITIKPIARRLRNIEPVNFRWTRFMGWVAVIVVLIPGVLFSVVMPWSYMPGFTKTEKDLRTALPHIEQTNPEHIVILNTSGFMNTIYVRDVLYFITKKPIDVWTLSSANGVFSLEKASDSSFVISTDRSGWLDNMFARLFRTRSKLKEGRRYETPLFSATLIRLTKSKRDVLVARFDFNESINGNEFLFLQWNGSAFIPIDFDALEIGKKIRLADTSDILKSMF